MWPGGGARAALGWVGEWGRAARRHPDCPAAPAAFPPQSAWANIRIPSVLISRSQGARLVRLMRTSEVAVEEHGAQVITA